MTGPPPVEDDGIPGEAALWRALRRDGSADARRALFEAHAPLARRMAMRHFQDRTSGDIDIADLRQLAYAGLLQAIDRFDPDRGAPFRAYAMRRVAGSILDGLAKTSEVRQQLAFRNRVRSDRVRSLLEGEVRRMSTDEAFRTLAELATGLAVAMMLDTGMVVAGDEADERPNAYQSLAWKQTMRRLFAELEHLPDRERAIVRGHYLDGLDFEQLADLLGVSKGRVSQLHRAAIGRLREQLTAPQPTF